MKNYSYHHLSFRQTINKFKTDSDKGLSEREAQKRLARYGLNEIPENKPRFPILTFLWHQINNAMVYILLSAAIITFFIDHILDTYIILAVILINTIIGFIQEYRANKTVEALKEMVVSLANVYRDGQLIEVSANQLVPGDIILLEEGDRVPADGRLIEAKSLQTVESSLTGEAFSVNKNLRVLPVKTPLADRKNTVWMGTFVVGGWAKAIVTATGAQTAIGKISQSLGEIDSGKSHFEEKTNHLVKQMAVVAILGAVITFLVGFWVRQFDFGEILIFSVASLVSGIPEGLPAVLIIILAVGASRMAKKNVIVRSLPVTETLSVTDVIAVDKTGTLTQNNMTVERVVAGGGVFKVLNGWQQKGSFLKGEQKIDPQNSPVLKKLIITAGLCSRAKLTIKENDQGNLDYRVNGDPTEAALTVLAHKADLKNVLAKFNLVDELPFNQKTRYKAVLVEQDDRKEIVVSGAPEAVIGFCSKKLVNQKEMELSEDDKRQILSQVQKTSRQAMRVIGLAYKKTSPELKNLSYSSVEDLIFIGFVGMVDPPRPGVREAIIKAQEAGIRIIIKTGDHKETALAIARQVGIADASLANSNFPSVLTGEELFSLPENKFKQAIETVSIFARLTPDMKLKILEALQETGHCVGMSGDGVNDALALKKADVGIAMGNMGSDVAREASDIVLADDNFASIVDAIEEGRIVFNNTRQASAFLVTTNLAEDLIVVISIIMGFPLPLLAAQILWLNLVTDGVTDLALAAEPGHGDVLLSLPRTKGENVLSAGMVGFLAPIVLVMVLATLGVFLVLLPQGIAKARTGAFAVMAFTQLFNIFNMRSLEKSLFKIGLLSNKYVLGAVGFSLCLQYLALNKSFFRDLFNFETLALAELVKIIFLSSAVFWCGEAYKLIRNFLQKAKS
ncbi:MAG: HAD-IC family P-type ATPase [Candidatus Shapirobacteria bacterium]|nr:HAD-IC family P-type ATPase [Candidatus Shapirobacteria bacterium]